MYELRTGMIDNAASVNGHAAADANWYALYTWTNHEKNVARQLAIRSFESFLPLYDQISRWKDRRVRVQLPLFSGYVFVRLALREKLRALQIPGVVRLVGFGGVPVPLSDREMETMRDGLARAVHPEPHPYLQVGRHVRLNSGPLQGLEGILIKKKTGYRFVLSIELIQRSVAVEVDAADIQAA
jgi:transcription antitermination factor NusG